MMVMVATFGLRCTVPTQGLLALLVISLSLAAHLKLRPHQDVTLDKLEFYGLSAAFVTLYFGMFFFTDDVVFQPWWGFVVTFTIMFCNSLFIFVFCLYLYGAFREESDFVKRVNTTITLKCYACTARCGNRLCCCCIWFLKRRDDRIEEHNRLKLQVRRHKRVTGDIWAGFDNGSAKKSAKERHKERLRRIKLNKDAGEERGLQMNIIPLADQFARRQKLMVKELEHSVVVRKKHTSMRNMVVDRSDDQKQEINTAVSQYFSVSPKGKRNFMGTLSSVLSAKQKFLRSQKKKRKEKRKEDAFQKESETGAVV